MELKQLIEDSHEIAKSKGFWDTKRNTGELLMLVTSELGEALESDRKNKRADLDGYKITNILEDFEPEIFKRCIKDSFEDEIADAVIRLFDLSAGMNIDLEWHILEKLKYNKTREKLHGKSY